MTPTDFSYNAIGWTAIATGITGILALVFIILFFTIGQPFGTLNDICIGLTAILSGMLAWMLYPQHHAQASLLSQAALLIAWVGAVVAVIGSVLVIFGIKGWYLAGLYMSVGYALIGLWLLALSGSMQSGSTLPQGLSVAGRVIGVIMAFGLAALPGIFQGIDSWDSAPWYINYVGLPASIGYLALYPTWCVWMGRIMLPR